jgi:hypothetical protein
MPRHAALAFVVTDRQALMRDLATRPRHERPDPGRRRRLRSRVAGLIDGGPAATPGGSTVVTIRSALAQDAPELAHLAEASERRVPGGVVLLAQVDAEVVAAVPVEGGPALTDLRHRTADVVQLLELRAAQLRRGSRSAA